MQVHESMNSSSKLFQEYCAVRNAEHNIKKKIPSQFASEGASLITEDGASLL